MRLANIASYKLQRWSTSFWTEAPLLRCFVQSLGVILYGILHCIQQSVKVVWHKAASPPHTDGSVVLARCHQCTYMEITWLPWQRPLVAGCRQWLHFVGRSYTRTPSITNRLVAVVHTKPVIAILVPKLVAMATSLSTCGPWPPSKTGFLGPIGAHNPNSI